MSAMAVGEAGRREHGTPGLPPGWLLLRRDQLTRRFLRDAVAVLLVTVAVWIGTWTTASDSTGKLPVYPLPLVVMARRRAAPREGAGASAGSVATPQRRQSA